MNRKIEDRLVQLAFGDLNPAEAQALEREIEGTPDAARLLAEYREIKSGFRLLADVPEDQLSKERLRDAILGQGLKPHRRAASFGWLWMPVGAAVLAFAFTMANHRAQPMVPTMALGGGSESSLAKPNLVVPSPKTNRVSQNETLPRNPLTPTGNRAPGSDIRTSAFQGGSRHRSRRHTDGLMAVDLSHDGPSGAEGGLNSSAKPAGSDVTHSKGEIPSPDTTIPGAVADSSRASTAQPMAMNAQPSSRKANGLVMIQPQRDAQTGAQVATEVDSTKNVEIGG